MQSIETFEAISSEKTAQLLPVSRKIETVGRRGKTYAKEAEEYLADR
jgi:hypothetical protein